MLFLPDCDRAPSIRPVPARQGSRIYVASTEYRTRDRVHTSSLENSPFRFRRDFNLSYGIIKKKKEKSFLFVFVLGRARNDSWGCVWCVCIICMYICEKGLSQQRERDRRAVEEEEKSFLHARENFERPCMFFFAFFFFTTTATATPLSGDRATRLVVLGSCPYHGTSHRALSLRQRALPMAASGSESTPAVA